VYWATPKQNADDRTLHGTTTRGEQSPVAVLTNEIASLIISDPRSSYELAKTIGVSASTVKAVRNGSTWGHLTNGMKQPTRTRKTLRGESNGNSVLTNEQVLEVYCGSTPGAELARRFGVSRTLIYRIRQGKVWRHVTLST
jgi:DNA-binding XRE family transcriptional regulator